VRLTGDPAPQDTAASERVKLGEELSAAEARAHDLDVLRSALLSCCFLERPAAAAACYSRVPLVHSVSLGAAQMPCMTH
jgi:hypothetical protein